MASTTTSSDPQDQPPLSSNPHQTTSPRTSKMASTTTSSDPQDQPPLWPYSTAEDELEILDKFEKRSKKPSNDMRPLSADDLERIRWIFYFTPAQHRLSLVQAEEQAEKGRDDIMRIFWATYGNSNSSHVSQNELEVISKISGLTTMQVTAGLCLEAKRRFWKYGWDIGTKKGYHKNQRLGKEEFENFAKEVVETRGVTREGVVEWLALQEAYRTGNSWDSIRDYWIELSGVDLGDLEEGLIILVEHLMLWVESVKGRG